MKIQSYVSIEKSDEYDKPSSWLARDVLKLIDVLESGNAEKIRVIRWIYRQSPCEYAIMFEDPTIKGELHLKPEESSGWYEVQKGTWKGRGKIFHIERQKVEGSDVGFVCRTISDPPGSLLTWHIYMNREARHVTEDVTVS